jgi:glucosamine-6-phosphate deaminase
LEKVKVAVPLSPDELYEKRMAIFKHQSQKDRAMFPGSDTREFWQRSEARNRDTAKYHYIIYNSLYAQLGFVNYEALECFVTLDQMRQDGEI